MPSRCSDKTLIVVISKALSHLSSSGVQDPGLSRERREPNLKDFISLAQRGQSIWTSKAHLSSLWGTWRTCSLFPTLKSMHLHPVFPVSHGLCAKYLLKKIEIFKKKKWVSSRLAVGVGLGVLSGGGPGKPVFQMIDCPGGPWRQVQVLQQDGSELDGIAGGAAGVPRLAARLHLTLGLPRSRRRGCRGWCRSGQ